MAKFGDLSIGSVGGDVIQAETVATGDVIHGNAYFAAEAVSMALGSDGAAREIDAAPDELGPIFVSHAHKDTDLVRALLALVAEGVAIGDGEVLATSLFATGIPAGENWAAYLKTRLNDTRLVVMVLTEQFLASQFCLMELGAVWALGKPVVPLVVPPLTMDDLGHVLAQMQQLDARNDEHLARVRTRVAEALGHDAPDVDLSGPIQAVRATFHRATEAQ